MQTPGFDQRSAEGKVLRKSNTLKFEDILRYAFRSNNCVRAEGIQYLEVH
jgi:hypothetical protein